MKKPTAQRQVFQIQSKMFGMLYSDQPPTVKKGIFIGVSIFFALYAIGGIVIIFASKGEAAILGILLALGFGVLSFVFKKFADKLQAEYDALLAIVEEDYQKQLKAVKRFKKEHPHYEDEELYRNAKKAGISDAENKANVSHLVLWAKNNGIKKNQDQLIASYNLGKSIVEKDTFDKQIKKQLEAEKKEEAEYTKYSNLKGRTKSARIIQHNISKYKREIAKNQEKINKVTGAAAERIVKGTKKEQSWATQGGLAAGIGGDLLGLAVAADVQRNNQAIRQHNAELESVNVQLAVLQSSEYREEIHKLQGKLRYWEDENEKNKMRLVEEVDAEQLLKKLVPIVIDYKNSPPGAVHLTVELREYSDLRIDGIRATLDGSFEISLSVNGTEVGTAIRTLPYMGISGTQKLQCICRNIKEQSPEYEFSFKPVNLWAIEKN